MSPAKRFFNSVAMFILCFVAADWAFALYRGEVYELPDEWPFILAAIITGAGLRLAVELRGSSAK